MLKTSLALAAALTFAASSSAALAQDGAAGAATEESAADTRVYTPVDFNLEEDRENILLLDLSNGERVAIRLKPDWAPNHVERVKTLTRQGFYDGIIFHRVIDGFMAQTGDPTGTGTGGSELPDIAEEFNPMPHLRGTVSMARSASPDSANSQFFIVFYPRFNLDDNYTNFGRVISNMAGVDAIQRGEPPANPTRILQASIAADNKPVPAMPAAPTADADISIDDLNAPLGN
ncbi:MAG: peptidylprolyl isomerase [Pseudomonadota bacterium]|uniref:peptidylprolyl isomerase n=1 Tax=Qipengyuania flava TaxID=192812 RepID=UPI0007C29C01|nr:peptidylprolyl isomerase [Qipengyuania flava]KZX54107.1 peptidylprolyl isomerase [Erythrobacter sp. HI00D59]KZX88082.1 peptidylprolyl isomerase [Erythrobacter sp. HI0020]KZY12530.1 peptidylprolyl isomerase [Erythrobacter sp. HI0037]KZY18285.1 peptidylprolyl isomerase [Erythrobacter sp. HI0038]MEC7160656.1 peptidylprolyl isomerase [Pseudomonadota bacterium]